MKTFRSHVLDPSKFGHQVIGCESYHCSLGHRHFTVKKDLQGHLLASVNILCSAVTSHGPNYKPWHVSHTAC